MAKILPRLIAVDKNFSAQKPESLRTKINGARAESKFPQVKDTAAIRDELKNIRYELRVRIQSELRGMNHEARAEVANRLFVAVEAAGTFGVVVEDFFDACRAEMNPFFNERTNHVTALLSKIKINAHPKFLDELAAELEAFADARRPFDKFSIALGTNDFDAGEEIFYAVRSTANDLYNKKHLIDEPLKIIRLLEENFSYLPPLAEVIRKDIEFLQEAKAQQPTKNFTEAIAVVESVRKAMTRGLHFAKGYEVENLNFYERFFKARHEVALHSLMIRRRYKPDEWRLLNLALAMIYSQMAAAMTWTRRADLALELYRTSLIYAETSGDKDMIATIRNDIAEIETSLPTESFLDAQAALDKIQEYMNQYLHFEKGFERANLDFYEEIFKKNCDVLLRGLMLPNTFLRKPKEWKILNARVAAIYLQMGTALTWTRRADLALELYQKALPYAEASGDEKVISLVRERRDKWRKIKAQIDYNSRSSGCLSVVAAVCIVLWLAL